MARQLALPLRTETPKPVLPGPRRTPEETVLYGVVHDHLESFLARAESAGRIVPRFVERELRAYLQCGLLQFGFLRLRCSGCGLERLVAFSCKGRGFCPSCVGRRMNDAAAHLVDRVLPRVPGRQWVLSLPNTLRYRLAYDRKLLGDVHRLYIRTVFSSYRRRARDALGAHSARAQCGAVTFIQRFGDALNLNVHFHSLLLDGVYVDAGGAAPRFHSLPAPGDAEIEQVARTLARRLERLLERWGFFDADAPDLVAADDSFSPSWRTPRCAVGSPWARVPGSASSGAAIGSTSRIFERPTLRSAPNRWRDGTTHIVFEPLELVEKLATLIPPPRGHLVRYHGVLGPAARRHAAVVAREPEPAGSAPANVLRSAAESSSPASPGARSSTRAGQGPT